MPMGVCHSEKVLHANTRAQTTEEALNSNQSTYKPCEVFSAGPVELLEELADGRLLIQVHTDTRLRLREEKQVLPFSIWACEEMPDEAKAGSARSCRRSSLTPSCSRWTCSSPASSRSAARCRTH